MTHACPGGFARGGAGPLRATLAIVAWVLLSLHGSGAAESTATRVLDDFTDLAAWKPIASDGVTASTSPATGPQGRALRLDFDLGGTAGYALVQRALPLVLPDNYELSFYVRAEAPVNDLQLKLIDASGDNVWWFHRRDFAFPREWRRVRIRKREIEFAWGPAPDHRLSEIATLEFAVAAGAGGGKGAVYLSRLELRPLPPEPAVWPPPSVRASSSREGADPALVVDGDRQTAWRSGPAGGSEQQLTLDFGAMREFGGLVLRWLPNAHATRYDVQVSDDGRDFTTVLRVAAGRGGFDPQPLPGGEARFLRLALHAGAAPRYGLAEIEIEPPSFGESGNAFFQAIAPEYPRGTFPRGFSGEQPWWTLVGIDGGHESALLSEDGALEVARGGFSIEPFVVADAKVVTWAEVEPQQSLMEGYLPIPSVAWRRPKWELQVTAFASGTPDKSQLIARYDVRNLTAKPLALTLVLALRPFQVNPPQQFLNAPGGVSAIRELAWNGTALTVNRERRVYPLTAPSLAGALPHAAGPPPLSLATLDRRSLARTLRDPTGYASGLLVYRLKLAPHATSTLGLLVPLSGAPVRPSLRGSAAVRWLTRAQDANAAQWREKLDRVEIGVPAQDQAIVDTLRTALAHILITRDGVVLRPGTRSYARSWIRDGAMMAESLAKLGHVDAASAYLRWYAEHLFADGKVPCCVDGRGADPVPENDSAGEFLFLAATVYRHTGDRALLAALWPRIEAAAAYLESLRQTERTPANLAPERRAFYGILPASISHEGYSDKPMHSYWDDFWALKGYEAALEIALALDRTEAAQAFARQRDEFRGDLAASLHATIAAHALAYLPGSAELGDFDPTSSAIALSPDGDPGVLPATALAQTYERYWREFVARRDARAAWRDYTPYELRNVSVFVRLGWRERAQEALAFFLAGRRPPAWNQWPEVVARETRKPRFVGDVPHGWVASDFIRAVLDMLAYERERDRAIVLAAGVPEDWLDATGVTVKGLATPYGSLSYSLRGEGDRIVLAIAGIARVPPGGFVFAWPGRQPPGPARVDGKPVDWTGNELRLRNAPVEVVIARHRSHVSPP